MLHLYTGEGKGKTTAAIGLSVRAAGRGFSVYFTQFMKGNDTGELYILKRLPEVKILRSEKNFGFFKRMSEEDKADSDGSPQPDSGGSIGKCGKGRESAYHSG